MTIFSQVPAQTLAEFRVNSLQGGARVSSFLFLTVAIGVSIYKYAVSIAYYTPRKLCLWESILFSRCPNVRPSIRPTDRVSVTFCFFNNFKNH